MELLVGLGVTWTSLVLFVCALCVAVKRIDEELTLDASIVRDDALD